MFVTQWIYVPSEYSQSHTSVFFFWRYYVETLASSFDFADHQEPCVTPRRKVWTTTNHASAQKRDLEKHFFVCRVLGANMKHAFLVTADFLTHVFLLFSFLTHLIDRRCLLLVFSFPPMKHQQLFVLFLYSFSDIYIYMCSFIFSYLPFFFMLLNFLKSLFRKLCYMALATLEVTCEGCKSKKKKSQKHNILTPNDNW